MPVKAIIDNYQGPNLDAEANFGGNIVVYVGWDEHLLFCSAKAFPLPPAMSFGDFKAGVMPEGFGQHPDFAKINWDNVEWTLNGSAISPNDDQSLADLGFDHKSLLRFKTPGLNGYKNTGV